MSKAAQKKEEQECSVVKAKLDNARRLRGICFIDPEDGEYKETTEQNTQGKKLEVPMEPTMPRKMGTKELPNRLRETASETRESNNIKKTKHACNEEAHESTRKRRKSTLQP